MHAAASPRSGLLLQAFSADNVTTSEPIFENESHLFARRARFRMRERPTPQSATTRTTRAMICASPSWGHGSHAS